MNWNQRSWAGGLEAKLMEKKRQNTGGREFQVV
jgi:hypothetical protein